jgi:ribosomal protein S18 acetylase RimI-like enzyme
MTSPRVRRATRADARDLARLSGELGYPSSPEEIERRLAAFEDRDDHAVLVAVVDGSGRAAVAGWLHVFLAERLESPGFAEIGGLVVARDDRGQGIGKRLTREARTWAESRGCSKLRVRSREERGAAHRFYESLGFRRTKTQAVLDLPLGD